MNRAALLCLLLCICAWSITPRAEAVELNYKLYVVAVPVATASIKLDLGTPAYRLSLDFQTTGIADLFAGDRLAEYTAGRIDNDRPAPAGYGSSGQLRGQNRVVTMSWRDSTPTITSITPPNNTEREDVPPALLAHSVDPLDAIVQLLREVARSGRCEGSSRAYDGRRLQLLQARTVGEEDVPPSIRSTFSGRALRCDFSDQTLAGYRLGSGRDDDMREHRGTIWLSQVLPGLQRLPVRASVETRWLGDATIYLTSATP
jgi:Protein of unknown function (DUF3108)